MSTELYRLRCESERSDFILVLTETHVTIEPGPEFRAEVQEAFERGREGSGAAPKVLGWIVNKALDYAADKMEKLFAPHPVKEVKLSIRGEKGDRVELKVDRFATLTLGEVRVDPTEAYIFEAKLRELQEKASG